MPWQSARTWVSPRRRCSSNILLQSSLRWDFSAYDYQIDGLPYLLWPVDQAISAGPAVVAPPVHAPESDRGPVVQIAIQQPPSAALPGNGQLLHPLRAFACSGRAAHVRLTAAWPVCQAEVDARVAMYTEEVEEELLGGRPDFVLDAIDNINTKVLKAHPCLSDGTHQCRVIQRDQCQSIVCLHTVRARLAAHVQSYLPAVVALDCRQALRTHRRSQRLCGPCNRAPVALLIRPHEPLHRLIMCPLLSPQVSLLAACHRRGIPVLCVAGAGAKADPSRLRIADVSQSNVDPLARAVRAS